MRFKVKLFDILKTNCRVTVKKLAHVATCNFRPRVDVLWRHNKHIFNNTIRMQTVKFNIISEKAIFVITVFFSF